MREWRKTRDRKRDSQSLTESENYTPKSVFIWRKFCFEKYFLILKLFFTTTITTTTTTNLILASEKEHRQSWEGTNKSYKFTVYLPYTFPVEAKDLQTVSHKQTVKNCDSKCWSLECIIPCNQSVIFKTNLPNYLLE